MTKLERELRKQIKYLLEDETVRPEMLSGRTVGWETNQFILDCVDEGVEEELLAYIKEHPSATFAELENYAIDELWQPLEMVDDDEDED